MSARRDGKGRKSSMNKGEESWSFQDLQDHLPTAYSSSSSGSSSSQARQKKGKKPVGKNHGGVQSYTSIMGYCHESGKFGVVAADTRVSQGNDVLSDGAGKVVTISRDIVMVGSGNEPIYTALKERILRFGLGTPMASTMSDVVECLTMFTQDCVDAHMEAKPNDMNLVYYIIIGKMANTVEMYTIGNAQDYGNVISNKEYARIVNGGSGQEALEEWQRHEPLDKYVEEYEAVEYCFKCMRYALKLDRQYSGGDIIMYSISIDDDEGIKLHAFPPSEVYGHILEPDEKKARLLVKK